MSARALSQTSMFVFKKRKKINKIVGDYQSAFSFDSSVARESFPGEDAGRRLGALLPLCLLPEFLTDDA